jgi:dTDP-4-amino-4,6-dideoxygalactose transaminase
MKGYNYRMEGIQGAILRVKLRHLNDWTEARRTRARLYDRLLEGAGAVLPREMPWARHVFHTYTIRVAERDRVQAGLRSVGIHTSVNYPIPIHLQQAYANLGYSRGDFPAAEKAAEEVLSLPMYPELTPAQVEEVAGAVRRELRAPVL